MLADNFLDDPDQRDLPLELLAISAKELDGGKGVEFDVELVIRWLPRASDAGSLLRTL